MHRGFIRATAAAALTMTAAGVSAADGVVSLKEVVVTATRSEETLENVPAAAEVITQKDMKRLGAYDLRSALRLAHNLNISEAGVIGMAVSLRGTSSSHTLILVNGMRMAAEDTAETSNAYELDRLSLNEVDRIEIVRGPSSALYGSDALGGVINIITRKPVEEGWTFGANTGTRKSNTYGRYDLGQQGKFNGSFAVNFQKVRKFSFHDDGNSTLYGPRQNFAFEGIYTLSAGRAIEMDLEYMKEHMKNDSADADGLSAGPVIPAQPLSRDQYQLYDNERKSVSLAYRAKTGASDFFIRAYYNRLNKENRTYNRVKKEAVYLPAIGQHVLTSTELPYHILADWDSAKYDTFVLEAKDTTWLSQAHRLTAGGEYRHLQYQGTRLNDGSKDSEAGTSPALKNAVTKAMDFSAFYFQDEWTPASGLYLFPAVRYDYSDTFGSHLSPKIGLTYKLKDNLRVKANYGRGFRAPTLSELYMYYDGTVLAGFPFFFFVKGNPQLKPETSLEYDISLEGESGAAFAKVSYFRNQVDNLIYASHTAFLPASGGGYFSQYQNINHAKIEGVETELGFHLTGRWTIKGTWNYLNALDEQDHSRIIGNASHYGTVQLLYDDGLTNGWSGVFWCQWAKDLLISQTMDGVPKNYRYHVFNAAIHKQWGQRISAFVGIDNIFNKEWEDTFLGGRLWRTGIEWTF